MCVEGKGGGEEGIRTHIITHKHKHTHRVWMCAASVVVGGCSIQRSCVCIYSSLSMCSMKGIHGGEGGGGGTEIEEAKRQEGVGS